MAAEPCRDFITAESTLHHFRDGWQPTVSDWRSSESWEQDGKKDAAASAHEKVRKILAEAPETLLTEEQEKDLQSYIQSIERP